jgi:hypothetical protein
MQHWLNLVPMAGALPALRKEARDNHYPGLALTRAERLLLAAAALRGALTGAARAVITCLLDQYIH